MAISNLGELKAQVADWLNREDLTTQIPDFIRIGTSRINHDARSRVDELQEYQILSVASENQINPLLNSAESEVESVVVDGHVIPHVTFNEYTRARKDNSYANGCWTWVDGKVLYSGWVETGGTAPDPGGPAQDVKYLKYGWAVWDFNDDNSTNALFNLHPEIFLYAALLEASVYLRDLEGIQIYQVRYEELMEKLDDMDRRRTIAAGFSVSSVGGDNYFDRSY